MDDGRIIELFFARSESAIAETQARYGKYCLTVARRILQSDPEAEECVNDAMLRIWNAVPPAKPENFRAYLRKVTRNLAVSRLEKLSAQRRGGGEAQLALEELTECVPSGEDPQRAAEDMAVRDALNTFLEGLPALTRRMFVLRYWYVMPVREIAQKLGVKESRVTVTLMRTREKLRDFLKKEGIDL